jgi:hypothetical protein
MATLLASPNGSVLPAYSPSSPVPSYAPEPAHDERRIQHTPRTHLRPTGTYMKRSGRDTVVLTEQDASAEAPTYGRHDSINGFVNLEERDTVSEIVLKVSCALCVLRSKLMVALGQRKTRRHDFRGWFADHEARERQLHPLVFPKVSYLGLSECCSVFRRPPHKIPRRRSHLISLAAVLRGSVRYRTWSLL